MLSAYQGLQSFLRSPGEISYADFTARTDELLYRAKAGDMDAKAEIFAMYRPLLIKYALVNRIFDEDLYQELAVELMKCIRYFRDVE